MPATTFWGRENELTRLYHFRDQANAGRGQVVFVAGEPGAGKSTLLSEFVLRSEEADAKLVAAIGQCNAYSGAGDPYLPFRQVLTVLTGADEVTQTGATVTPTNAARLSEFARVSGQTLVEVAPDLIGIFVPGASLIAKVVSKAMQASKLTDRLAQQLEKIDKPKTDAPLTPTLDQEQIFEQYAKALQALSRDHTLILILDDLQWADNASLNLLFYLTRQLQESRVLIVGAYRPGDVALGRGGERHPFEQVLNELKRYQGDIVVDLDETVAREGRAFVDAVIDSEPNCLDESFRRELFAHTAGHPLFTIELLHNLQERGGLVQDAGGRWIKDETLDWTTLPARVEGVIEERISRLAGDLHETLTIASVMGVNFTAQVVGRVQQVEERVLLKNLARELDKRHHLVQEVGESKVGKQILSGYRFTHALVQQFIYGELSAGERRMMHGDVAAELEALYEGHCDQVAVQLAQHYQEAGDDEKAITYLSDAGDIAFNLYAQQEAIAHFRRALELGAESGLTPAQSLHLYTRLGRAYELAGAFEDALKNYGQMEEVALTRHDRVLELEALMLRATLLAYPSRVEDLDQAQRLLVQAQALARELNDRKAEARTDWALLLLNRLSSEGVGSAIAYGEHSIALARELNLREQLAFSLKDIVLAYWRNGQLEEAERAVEEAEPIWRELNNKPMLAETLATAAGTYTLRGKLERAVRAGQEAYELDKSFDNRSGLVTSAGGLAIPYFELGQLGKYLDLLAIAKHSAEEVGSFGILTFYLHHEALARAELGDAPRALELAQQVAANMQKVPHMHAAVPQAILMRVYMRQESFAAAQALAMDVTLAPFDEYLHLFPQFTFTAIFSHAELALAQGDTARALQIAGDLFANLQRIGVLQFLPEVLRFQAEVLRDQQRIDEAYAALLDAKERAEAMAARTQLWPIFAALADLEVGRGNQVQAAEWRTQAYAIVDALAQTLPLELRAKFLNRPLVRSVQKSTT